MDQPNPGMNVAKIIQASLGSTSQTLDTPPPQAKTRKAGKASRAAAKPAPATYPYHVAQPKAPKASGRNVQIIINLTH